MNFEIFFLVFLFPIIIVGYLFFPILLSKQQIVKVINFKLILFRILGIFYLLCVLTFIVVCASELVKLLMYVVYH